MLSILCLNLRQTQHLTDTVSHPNPPSVSVLFIRPNFSQSVAIERSDNSVYFNERRVQYSRKIVLIMQRTLHMLKTLYIH